MPTVDALTHAKHDSAAVRRLLAAGQTTFIDPATGHLQALTADCPTDGQPASVRRVTRESGAGILEVTMRCTRCAGDFVAPAQTLYLS
jgi:hypothetical protein